MEFSTIVTIGPSIQSSEKLQEINALGPCIFRLNGAHVSGKDVLSLIEFVRSLLPDGKVMVDLPGNKIRLAHLPYAIPLQTGEKVELLNSYFNYTDLYKHLDVGDVLLANDSTVTLEITRISPKAIEVISYNTSELLPRKGVYAEGVSDQLPFLFEKDIELIDAACQAKSFVGWIHPFVFF